MASYTGEHIMKPRRTFYFPQETDLKGLKRTLTSLAEHADVSITYFAGSRLMKVVVVGQVYEEDVSLLNRRATPLVSALRGDPISITLDELNEFKFQESPFYYI